CPFSPTDGSLFVNTIYSLPPSNSRCIRVRRESKTQAAVIGTITNFDHLICKCYLGLCFIQSTTAHMPKHEADIRERNLENMQQAMVTDDDDTRRRRQAQLEKK
ncbi:hypothetical protein BGZ65_009004, partial [Modicella reniformis]